VKSISIVVNARIGSTRLPNKVILPFAGTTLIDIALSKINNCDYFDKRYLAVYDNELKDKLVDYKNVELIDRDIDEVKSGIVDIKTRFKYFEKIETDLIFLLNPCCPLISENTIKYAYEMIKELNYNSYTSVVPSRDWVFDVNGKCITRSDVSNVATNKGDIFHKATHAFHILNRQFFLDNGYIWTFGECDPAPIGMPKEEYCDIDNLREFEIAEFLYNKYLDKKFNFISEYGYHVANGSIRYSIKLTSTGYKLVERLWVFQGEKARYNTIGDVLSKGDVKYLVLNKGIDFWHGYSRVRVENIMKKLGIKK
jgi:CMP-N-acetylneuraminic acid synthetase